MFAGIIEHQGRVLAADTREGIRRVRISTPRGWKLKLGQSIDVDGICSTATAVSKSDFTVQYMPETLSKTTAGEFTKGTVVNLERSLTLNTLIDGHMVQGHVDARAKVAGVVSKNGTYVLTLALPSPLKKFVAGRGSITVNGVALTVAQKRGSICSVALIPYTIQATNLGALKKGNEVNIETDLIARYLAALT